MVIQGLRKKDDLPAVENLPITQMGDAILLRVLYRMFSIITLSKNMIYQLVIPFSAL